MKKLIGNFIEFHQEYFHPRLYLNVFLFIAFLITFNYWFDFEDSCIDRYYGRTIRILFYFLYHAFAFYGVLLIIWWHDRAKIKFTLSFWLKSLFGLLILGTDRAIFPMVSKIILVDLPTPLYRFYFKILFNSYGLITITFVLLLFKFIFDRKAGEGLYGLQLKKVDFKVYWLMLAAMVPVIALATLLPGIQEYYPTYKRVGGAQFAAFYQVGEWVSILFYESIYLIDFINTELFFRGFMVIGLSRLMGKNVILPMVAAYVVLHFGKPAGEAISSVFGGYMLGIVALYSRNIWGGVFLHGGIALLMELFAFLKNQW
jgi:hypothetical protein